MVFSLDLNPAAVRYHVINNALNGVRETIDVICGDARQIASTSLVGCADRVLLPLPDLAVSSLAVAKGALRNGHGFIHCYVFVDSRRRVEAGNKALLEISPALERIGATDMDTQAHVVRSVGHCRYQVCLDIHV